MCGAFTMLWQQCIKGVGAGLLLVLVFEKKSRYGKVPTNSSYVGFSPKSGKIHLLFVSESGSPKSFRKVSVLRCFFSTTEISPKACSRCPIWLGLVVQCSLIFHGIDDADLFWVFKSFPKNFFNSGSSVCKQSSEWRRKSSMSGNVVSKIGSFIRLKDKIGNNCTLNRYPAASAWFYAEQIWKNGTIGYNHFLGVNFSELTLSPPLLCIVSYNLNLDQTWPPLH